MKKNQFAFYYKLFSIFVFLFLISFSIYQWVKDTSFDYETEPLDNQIILFYSPSCTGCMNLEEFLEEHSINYDINKINVTQEESTFLRYVLTYTIPTGHATTPLVLAGDDYYHGYEDIVEAIKNGDLAASAKYKTMPISDEYSNISDDEIATIYEDYSNLNGIGGFLLVFFGGLADGFNPCAVAMLLLFISMLGFSENKKTLIYVSISYIFGLFISYFAFGTVLFQVLSTFESQVQWVSLIFSYLILILCLFLALLNFHDFIASKTENYQDVKNQLPKPIQKLNKKIISKFTGLIHNEEQTNQKYIRISLLAFLLGFIISLTEFMCTGQVYLGVLVTLIHVSEFINLKIIIYLIIYNLMFVSPLIIISLFAIKSKSSMGIANFMREKEYIIKIINTLLFLGIAVFYFIEIFF